MSIRFPTDNHSGMSRPNAPRKRGGGGLFFLLIFGVIAFMIMNGISSSPGPADRTGTDRSDRSGVTQYPDLQQPRAPRADQSDWGLDTDAAVQRNASSEKASSRSSNSKTSNNDWGLDTDVNTTPKSTVPKKTVQGDWGLEQVDQ